MVRAEVDSGDLVLGVGVLRDLRYNLVQTFWRDSGQFHLYIDSTDVCLVPGVRVVDGGCGLAAVDDLQVVDALDRLASPRQVGEVHICCGGGDAVVVGQEPVRAVQDRLSHTLVDRAAG